MLSLAAAAAGDNSTYELSDGDILESSNQDLAESSNNEVYVNYTGGSDENSGSDWGSAFRTVEKALDNVDNDGTIHLSDGITYLRDSTANTGITINKKVSIIGQGTGSVISGNDNKRIFSVAVNGALHLSNLTLAHGYCDNGGAISIESSDETSYGKLTMINSVISDCHASSSGGAIYTRYGSISNINNVTFINDSSVSSGGAIAVIQKGSLSDVNDCRFINNTANNRGGAIYLGSNSNCKIGNNNCFKSNNALGNYGYGGAIHGGNGIVLGTGNVFADNFADKSGSVLSTSNNKKITGSYCFFINNTADYDSSIINGAGTGTVISLENCYWASNTPNFSVFVNKGTFTHNGYLTLTVACNDSISIGEKLLITVDLSKNQNNQTVDVNSLPKNAEVLFTTGNGNFDRSEVRLANGIAQTNYIPQTVEMAGVNVDICGLVLSLKVNVLPKAGTVFVNSTGGSDSRDGSSWSDAVKTLSHALAIVGDDCPIYVAGGTYQVNNLAILKNISLIGIGEGAVLDGENTAGIFSVNGRTVNFTNLIFKNAKGAISAVNSRLNIAGCSFISNSANSGGGAVSAKNTDLDICGSIFANNTGTVKSVCQTGNGDLKITNSVLLDGISSVQVENPQKATLEDNWWGNNNLNRNFNSSYTNINVKSYLILETSITQNTIHAGDVVGVKTSFKRDNLPELPISISAHLGTLSPNRTAIKKELLSVYLPAVSGEETITVNVLGVKNILAFTVKNTLPKVSIESVSTPWSSGIYPGVENSFYVKLLSNESGQVANLTVELLSNESDKVLDTITLNTLNGGITNISLTDKSIREITERTVWPDAQDNKIRFYVNLKYDGETISAFSCDKMLAYNGYFNRTYAYGNGSYAVSRNCTVNGDVIIATQGVGVYRDQFTLYRNETWNIKTPDDAQIVRVLLYFNYNWDTSFFPDGWSLKFNGHDITGEHISHEMDRGNLGQWGAYNYGVLVFDVTDYYNANADNSFVINKTKYCALYPSTLYVLYNVTDSTDITEVYFSDVCDVFYPLYNGNGYDDLLKFSVDFNNINMDDLTNAGLYVFAGSSSLNNNLTFNSGTIANPFVGYSPNDCKPYVWDVTDIISENNVFSFISGNQASTTVAYEQVLVVKRSLTTLVEFDDLTLEADSTHALKAKTLKPQDAKLTYSSNDTDIADVDDNGVLMCKNVGKALITVTADGGRNYPKNTTTFTVTVNKKTPSIAISADSISYGEDLIVNVELDKAAGGSVNVSVDGISETVRVINGWASASISNLKAGNKTVNVSYSGDGKFNSASQSKKIRVSKANPTFYIDVRDIDVGQDLAVNVSNLPADAEGEITASVNGFGNSSQVRDSVSNILISQNLTNGTYDVAVTYTGDANYNSFSASKTVRISKIMPIIDVSASNVKSVGDNLTIKVSGLPIDGSDYLFITGDINVQAEVKNSTSEVTVPDLKKGSYGFIVHYPGNWKYSEVYLPPITVDVGKIDVNFTVTAENITYGEIAEIRISDLPADAEGLINVIIDNVQFNSTASNPRITISDLGAKSYSAKVRYSNDSRYMADEKTVTFTVFKADPAISITADEVCAGDTLIVSVKLNGTATGSVSVDVDGRSNTGDLINGSAEVSISHLTAGEKNISVKYSGDENYNGISENLSVRINKLTPSMVISADSISYGEDLIVYFELDNAAGGNVTVSVDGKSDTAYVINGRASVCISNLTAGNKTVRADYSGDDNYNPLSASKYVGVNKTNPTIIVSVPDKVSYGDSLNVNVTLTGNATGMVVVSIDSHVQRVNVAEGIVSVEFSNLTAGSKLVNVDYSGDDNYNPLSLSESVDVCKANPSLDISAEDIEYGENLTVMVSLNDDAAGMVIIHVDNQSCCVNVDNGIAAAVFSDLSAGSKIVDVSYAGDNNYNNLSAGKEIDVIKINPDISILADDIVSGEILTVTINLNKDATGLICISVEDIHQTVTIDGGVAIACISNLSAGVKSIDVSYDGDGNYNSISKSKDVNVYRINTNMTVSCDEISYGEDLIVNVNVDRESTGNVSILIDGKNHIKSVEDGFAQISISKMNAGNYTLTVTYGGDDNHKNASVSFNALVRPINVTLNISVPSEIMQGENLSVTVDLSEDAAGYAVIYDDGKPADNRTVADSGAVFTLGNLTWGLHTITVAYSGDANHNPISQSSVVNVTKEISKKSFISVIATFTRVANDYNAGERGDFFYAVLLDENGNPLANKTVQIVLNGPIYNVTTDSLGRAGLQVNLANANTYTYALFFSGDGEYDASLLASTKLTVTKKETAIKSGDVAFKKSKKIRYLSATLKTVKNPYDGKTYLKSGKKLTLRINGKTYTSKTNSKGVAKFKIILSKNGKFSATIKFAGDGTYKACIKKIKITVK